MKKYIRLKPSNKATDLTKRTKLNPKQLTKVKGSSGGGLSSRYTNEGKQSIELTRRLQKAKRKAKRYVLFTDVIGRRLFVADQSKIDINKGVAPLTFDRKEALEFFHGFDDPEIKRKYYNETTYAIFKWQVL